MTEKTQVNPARRNDAAMEFLLTRRSRPAKTLLAPAPDAQALREILTAAARSPDHGKLEPWRFLVISRTAAQRLGAEAEARAKAQGEAEDKVAKAGKQFFDSQLCVAVISSPKESDKVPQVEQLLSAGAVCLSLLNAALAAGWGANWLTGWAAHDAEFGRDLLGLAAGETVVGFVHLGAEGVTPPERPRPDIDAITGWMTE
ncbi:nitroreductase family protein [Thioclava atlantica]|uniref:Putative NAD(P)H nitroreductase n=1 Tax=Thioclava atlantica TaxID=1317124 RepID=A0A085U1B0_9RHOB|nr:nitroreductase [Thioclava atlantica]KFE36757.1 nitroreductase [Thioclava atlantica]